MATLPPAAEPVHRLFRWAPTLYHLVRRYHNILLFVGGFLFDVATLKRIDSWLDLGFQIAYLACLTFLLNFQHKQKRGLWRPGPRMERVWRYNVEVLHFFYGGLLCNYVVFYSKSSSGLRPLVFFVLLVGLMLLNEMPQIRRVGSRLRLGLYCFCVTSFMIYFVPVLVGRIAGWVFAVSILSSFAIAWAMAHVLAGHYVPEERRTQRFKLFLPAGAVLTVIPVLYILRLVPPVPLSVKYDGIYHDVEKTARGYVLRAQRPPLYMFWRRDSRPFRARPGDRIFYFARVFAPRRFQHRVMLRWEYWDEKTGRYVTSDRIPMTVIGGRGEGFRGFAVKSNFQPGLWRASVETEDGRTVGYRRFRVIADAGRGDRSWIQWEM
jgi:hypothetical protein